MAGCYLRVVDELNEQIADRGQQEGQILGELYTRCKHYSCEQKDYICKQ